MQNDKLEKSPEKTKQNEKVIDSKTVEKCNSLSGVDSKTVEKRKSLSGGGESGILERKGSNWKKLASQHLLKCQDDFRSIVLQESQERKQQLLLKDLEILKEVFIRNSDTYGNSDVLKSHHGSPKARDISDYREFTDTSEIKTNDLRGKHLPYQIAGVHSQYCRFVAVLLVI